MDQGAFGKSTLLVGAFWSPPLILTSAKDGFSGVLPFLISEAAKKLGLVVVFTPCLLQHLTEQSVFEGDASIGLFETERRLLLRWRYSKPLYKVPVGITRYDPSDISSPNVLLVKDGDIGWEWRERFVAKFPNATLVVIPSEHADRDFDRLIRRQGTAAVIDAVTLESLQRLGMLPEEMSLDCILGTAGICVCLANAGLGLATNLGCAVVDVIRSKSFADLEQESLQGWKSLNRIWPDWSRSVENAF